MQNLDNICRCRELNNFINIDCIVEKRDNNVYKSGTREYKA